MDDQRNKCVHQLLRKQAAKTLDQVALIACHKKLAYTDLNEQANRIAHSLVAQCVRTNDVVEFTLSRISCLPTVIAKILKVSTSYLSIEPTCPNDRISYFLRIGVRRCSSLRISSLSATSSRLSVLFGIKILGRFVAFHCFCKCATHKGVQGFAHGLCVCCYSFFFDRSNTCL